MVWRLFTRRLLWSCLVVALLLVSSTTSLILSFSALADDGELRRDEIVRIAERYVAHSWRARIENVLHTDTVSTPNREYYSGWSDWKGWSIGDNVRVPYQWGGWSSLADPDLLLGPDDDGKYFDKQLEEGYPAGDIDTAVYYRGACGVDCSGLVSRAWRTHVKYGTSGLRATSRPIKFADLRAGDLLYRDGHVMLFKEFTTPEWAVPGTTKFRVIEASGYDWKVSEREYLLQTLGPEISENWRGTNCRTNEVTLERISDGTRFTGYWPRTYLNPIDIVLGVDRSGSMSSGSKLESAKEAAKMFVEVMRTGDKIGVVDFSSMASITYPLTEIDSEGTVKTTAKAAIDSLYASGMTSIGAGLQKCQEVLNTGGADDPVRVIVLLSNGLENTPPHVADVLPGIIGNEIVVYAVGLGRDADQESLQSIAEQTGGTYHFSPSGRELRGIYNAISAVVYGERVVRTASGTVGLGETVEEGIQVDSTVGEVTFSLFWSGSDLDLVLVQPDGAVIDPSVVEADPNISFASGPTYEFYKVIAPQYGEWTMRILGISTPSEGEGYTISASVTDAMLFSVESNKPSYHTGESIKITASIEDSFLDVTEPQYILGVAIEVSTKDPAQNVYHFDLYDDGIHGDGEANDGIYANTFTDTSLVGSYVFYVKAAGLNNRDNQPFTREYAFSTVVIEQVNAPPIADAGGPYEAYEGQSVLLDASGSFDPDENIVLYEWDLDNDGEYDDTVGLEPEVMFYDNGTYPIGLRVTDEYGESDTDTAEVVVNNVPPEVSADPASQTVQYSDHIADVTITATDVANDALQVVDTNWSVDGGGFAPGLPSNLALTAEGCGASDNTNSCDWTLSGIANVAAGEYTVRITVEDDDGGQTDADVTATVLPEDATVAFEEENPVAVQVADPGGDSGLFFLTVYVSEKQPDEPVDSSEPGDISLADVSVNLVPVGPGGSVAGVCAPDTVTGSGYDTELPVTCEFDDVPVNTYSVQVTVNEVGYYAGYGEDVLVIYDPSLGFTTGGGWFYWPGTTEKTNFGYTMKYNKKGQKVRGNLLLIRHLPDGSIYRIKSNALNGLALGDEGDFGWASFSGKSTYLEPGLSEPEGNHEFLVYVEDHNEPGTGFDQFWIEVKDKDREIVLMMSMERPATGNTVQLEGGNIVVPHGGGGRRR